MQWGLILGAEQEAPEQGLQVLLSRGNLKWHCAESECAEVLVVAGWPASLALRQAGLAVRGILPVAPSSP